MNAPETRRVGVGRVLWITLGLNLLVALAKLVVGGLIHSIAMVADAFHSLTDAASNVVGLVGNHLAARPPDADHPYGHQKFETLSALAIGGFLTLTAWEILKSCLERWREGGAPEVTAIAFVVMAVTLTVNLSVSMWEERRGRALGSEILRADAAHTRSDVYASLVVVASLVASRLGYSFVDPLAALLVTAVIARTAFGILRENAQALVDTAAVPPVQVREVALGVTGVRGVHKIRTRAGVGGGHADLHVQVAPDLRLDQAHVIGHLVADRLKKALGLSDVVAHVEPPEGHRTDWLPD